jgi:translation initiation factor 1
VTTKPSNHPFAKLAALRTAEPSKAGAGSPADPSSTGRPLAPGVSTRPPPPPPKPAPPPRDDPASAIKQAPPKPIASSTPSPSSAAVSHHPFAKLQALRTAAPAAPAGAGAASAASSSAAGAGADGKGPAWAVIRLERKGRGGKEATIVEKLGLPPAELEQWCKDLKQTLGCGGVVEGDAIILQGDLRPRLPAVLTRRGVRKVTVG